MLKAQSVKSCCWSLCSMNQINLVLLTSNHPVSLCKFPCLSVTPATLLQVITCTVPHSSMQWKERMTCYMYAFWMFSLSVFFSLSSREVISTSRPLVQGQRCRLGGWMSPQACVGMGWVWSIAQYLTALHLAIPVFYISPFFASHAFEGNCSSSNI